MRTVRFLAAALALAFGLGAAAMTSAADAKGKPADGAKPAGVKSDGAGLPNVGTFSLTSKKEPIQITSDKLDFDYKNRRTVFRGNVDVIQGDVHLQTDTMTVDYSQVGDKQELKTVIADGHVTIMQGPKKATGNHAVFDQGTRTVVLTGDALLAQDNNQVAGDRIVVYPDESRMQVLGENRRVKVVLFPGQEKGALASGKDGLAAQATATAAPEPTPQAVGANSTGDATP